MRRRDFITILGGASATLPFAAKAQEAGRTYRLSTRLGVLLPLPRDAPVNVAFVEEFRRHGFIEGQNLIVEWRAYGLHFDLVSQYAAELVGAQVDVIATGGEEAIRAAQQATKTIPIVALVDDLLASGHVKSLAHPDGNTTGVSVLAVDLDGKRQEILTEAVPGLRRMAALADINKAAANLDALKEAARVHNVELSIHQIGSAEEITAAIDMARASGATALNVLSSPILYFGRRLIMDRVAMMRMPTIYQWP